MVAGVEFEEDTFGLKRPNPVQNYGAQPAYSPNMPNAQYYAPNNHEPKMVNWLVRKGFAKSPRSAQVILLVLVILNFVITYLVIKYLL